MDQVRSKTAGTPFLTAVPSNERKDALSETDGSAAGTAEEPVDIKQPLVWQNDNLSFRLWGNLRNLVNYNHLRNDAVLNPDDIFRAPKFINLSEARLKLDGTILDNIGLFIHDRLQYEIDKNSHDWETDSDNTLDQAYASFRFGEELLTFWSIGKQRIKWGTGKFWTPVDTINPQQDLAELEPLEEGRVAYRADIAHKTVSVTGVAVPDADSTAFSLDKFGFDGNTSLLTGKIDFFVWDSDLTLYVSDKQQQAARVGASFATVISDIQFFGEAIFWHGASEREYVVQTSARQTVYDPVGDTSFILPAQFAVETRDASYYKMLLGLQYTFTNDLSLIFEYYHRKDGYDKKDMETYVSLLQYAGGRYADDVASTMLAQERNPMLALPDSPSQEYVLKQGAGLYDFARLRRNYLHLSAYWPYRFGNRIDLGVDTITNVDDVLDGNGGSYFIRPLVAYTGFQDWRFTLYSQLYLGSDETEFGILPYDWGAFFQIKYFF
ncbi:MAG: hypothetical protein JSW26_06500 [Desulfobacterales bacterium]|nr:MAG: hypothetical protein JSW26_06500 [Desulfobacterales bacterium]